MYVNFFGLNISVISKNDIDVYIQGLLASGKRTLIATVNPEMLIAAKKNRSLKRVLSSFSVLLPDGFGVSLMSFLTGQGLCPRYPGVDLFIDICKHANKGCETILILGGWGKHTETAVNVLSKAFPNVRFCGIGDVEIYFEEGEWRQPESLMDKIRVQKPTILAVALGGEKYDRQERWIVDHAPEIGSLKVALGVGGAIDMISGRVRRAPELMRKTGLEWLWRLYIEPRRFFRIFRAVLVFPVLAFWDRISLLIKGGNRHD